MTAAAEKFMPDTPQRPEALDWLSHAPQTDAAPWVKALRATGAEVFARTGLPTPAWEGWQYTNLRALSPARFHYSAAPVKFDPAKLPAPLLAGASRIVVVNGQYQPALSTLSSSLRVKNLMEAAGEEGIEENFSGLGSLAKTPFKALNAAHLRDGFVLQAEGDVAAPVEVLFYNFGNAESPPALYPRALYRLGRNAGLTVIERHMGEGAYFADSAIDAVLAEDSRFRHYRFMQESGAAFHISFTAVQQQKASSFEGFSYASGARVARQEYAFELIDSVISTGISGVYVLKDQQNHDFTVLADHMGPNGKSDQYFKGVVDAEARSFFQGKIHLSRRAQGTAGDQRHHALLVSDRAEASAKPELEIYADDVKCSHGATSGHLDPVALFYLRSRGIPEAEAKDLLIESFLLEAIERVKDLGVRDLYKTSVTDWLAERRKA